MTFKPGDKVTPKQGIGLKYSRIAENSVLFVLDSVETAEGEKITFGGRSSLEFLYLAKYFRLYEETPVQTSEPGTTEGPLKPFYFVWNKAGGAPNKSHVTRQSADKEAKRLAAATPGQKFFVLEVVGAAHLQIAKDVSYDLYSPEQQDSELQEESF